MKTPKVSIIICTLDRASDLEKTLESFRGVQIPEDLSVELVIIDNGSIDRTTSVVNAFDGTDGVTVRYDVEPQKGKSRALNRGMRQAGGDIFLFTDDDIRFPENWIRKMCDPMLQGLADAVQGGIRWAPQLLERVGQNSFIPAAITSTDHKKEAELRDCLIGANMGFTRLVYDGVGNFDEKLGPGALGLGEETLYYYRMRQLGFNKLNILDIQVEHHFDPSRLSRAALLNLAERKGRSLAYIDCHWNHLYQKWSMLRLVTLWLKDFVRTVCSVSAWPARPLLPPWKYSYRASLSYLKQMRTEQRSCGLRLFRQRSKESALIYSR